MILSKETMESLIQKTHFPLKNKYRDASLNKLLNYWLFLDEQGTSIQKLTGESIENVLYSKYYWSARYKDLYLKLYGEDAGLEQYQHKILEELDYTLNGGIDWELIQTLEQDRHLY